MQRCEQDSSQCPIFRGLSADERFSVLQISEVRTYETGQTIIRQGCEDSNGLWMVRSGDCEAVFELQDCTEEQLTTMHSGDIFGEVSFFDPAPHSASIRALTGCEFMFVPQDKLDDLCQENLLAVHKLTVNVAKNLSFKLRRLDQLTLGRNEATPLWWFGGDNGVAASVNRV